MGWKEWPDWLKWGILVFLTDTIVIGLLWAVYPAREMFNSGLITTPPNIFQILFTKGYDVSVMIFALPGLIASLGAISGGMTSSVMISMVVSQAIVYFAIGAALGMMKPKTRKFVLIGALMLAILAIIFMSLSAYFTKKALMQTLPYVTSG